MTKIRAHDIAVAAARAASDKKADDVQILDMTSVMVDTEFFVICSTVTHVQIRTIVREVIDQLDELGAELLRHEGRGRNNWELLDYGNVVVHVFLSEAREHYNLEKLWADAKPVPYA